MVVPLGAIHTGNKTSHVIGNLPYEPVAAKVAGKSVVHHDRTSSSLEEVHPYVAHTIGDLDRPSDLFHYTP